FFPSILPDGRSVLFTVLMSGSVDNAEIALLDLKTGRRKTLIRGGTNGEYVEVTTPTGKAAFVLYASGGALRAIRFDPDRLEVAGDPIAVADQVRIEATGAAQFSVSRDGSLVYVTGGTGSFENRSLVWVDRQGREQPINLPPRAYALPRISPDGTRVALFITDQDQDIWILDLPHLTLSR